MAAAPKEKMLFPELAFAAVVPTKGELLRLPNMVSGLIALTASDSTPKVSVTGDAEVNGPVDPNLKIGVADNEGVATPEEERLILPLMDVKAVVGVVALLLLLPVAVTVSVELLDEF